MSIAEERNGADERLVLAEVPDMPLRGKGFLDNPEMTGIA